MLLHLSFLLLSVNIEGLPQIHDSGINPTIVGLNNFLSFWGGNEPFIVRAHLKQPVRKIFNLANQNPRLILRGGSSEVNPVVNTDTEDGQNLSFKKMITSQFEDLFSDNWKQELGYVCLGFGAFFLASALNPLPFLGLWMNRKAILLANIMMIVGSTLLVGFSEMQRFFLSKSRVVGSVLIIAAFCTMWRDRSERWTVLAFMIQLLGVLSLFGPYAQSFFRFASQFVFPMIISIPSRLFRSNSK